MAGEGCLHHRRLQAPHGMRMGQAGGKFSHVGSFLAPLPLGCGAEARHPLTRPPCLDSGSKHPVFRPASPPCRAKMGRQLGARRARTTLRPTPKGRGGVARGSEPPPRPPPKCNETLCVCISVLVRPTSARFCQPLVLTSTRAVARSEQIEARGRRNPEAHAVYVEGFRRPRTKRCDAYRHGASLS